MSMVQYGLWSNCTNSCDFCLLRDRIYKSEEDRLYILKSIKDNIRQINWSEEFLDGISLLGGEIYYTDSDKVKESFLELIEDIIQIILLPNKTAKYSTVTNGIYDSKILLEPTLDLFKKYGLLDRVDISFSWDLKYRFHTEESLQSMIKNTNLVYKKYDIVPWVQTCLTQYLIDAHLNNTFNIFNYQKENFPNTELAFLYPHKINTGKVLNDFFFTRHSFFKFIKWLKDTGHNDNIQQIIQSVVNSSQFKYTGIYHRGNTGKNLAIDSKQRPTLERKQILTKCGHSQLYRCYSDSDKCLLCDLLNVV